MPDRIIIDDLHLTTSIGVTDAERATAQRILISVEMETDTRTVGKTDRLEDTTNYSSVAESVRTLAKSARNTIEKLAEDIAEEVLRQPLVEAVTVTVKKFALKDAVATRVVIERRKQ